MTDRWNPRTFALLALVAYAVTPLLPPALLVGVVLNLSAVVLGFGQRATKPGRDGLVVGSVTLVLLAFVILLSIDWTLALEEVASGRPAEAAAASGD